MASFDKIDVPSGVTERLRTILSNMQADPAYLRRFARAQEVYSAFGARLRSAPEGANVAEQVIELLDFKVNHHWTGLSRYRPSLKEKKAAINKTMQMLLDEKISLNDRLQQVDKMNLGIGRNLATAILHIAYPDKYAIWNGKSDKALKSLQLLPKEQKTRWPKDYGVINAHLKSWASALGVDLWTLDWIWEDYTSRPKESQSKAEHQTLLLTWKNELEPLNNDYFDAMEAKLSDDSQNHILWRCVTKEIKTGATFYLIKLGKTNPGIVASGQVLGPAYDNVPGPSKKNGKPFRRIRIKFDEIFDPSRHPTCALKTLQETYQPASQWTPQASGITLKAPAVPLEILWQRHLHRILKRPLAMASTSQGLWSNCLKFSSLGPDDIAEIWPALQAANHFAYIPERQLLVPVLWAAPVGMNFNRFQALIELSKLNPGFRGFEETKAVAAIRAVLSAPYVTYSTADATLPRWLHQAMASLGGSHPKTLWRIAVPATQAIQVSPFTQLSDLPSQETHVPENPNRIFYGPPGCGKTRLAIEEAVRLCTGSLTDKGNWAETMRRFVELQESGRVEFVTFHQSYSYEDFVEGIRPIVQDEDLHATRPHRGGLASARNSSDQSIEGAPSSLQFECRPGIFKKLCRRAEASIDVTNYNAQEMTSSRVWKISLGEAKTQDGEAFYCMCLRDKIIALSYREITLDPMTVHSEEEFVTRASKPGKVTRKGARALYRFARQAAPGDIVVVSQGNHYFRAIGRIAGEYRQSDADKPFHSRGVEWIADLPEKRPWDQVSKKKFSQLAFYSLSNSIKRPELTSIINSKGKAIAPPHVLIIDEINRGNISAIFGELITLIEKDKRIGEKSGIRLKTPYSQDLFGVPNNIYIIGTMNSSDRSIDTLDLALRRRFQFQRLSPNEELLAHQEDSKGKAYLRHILKTINQRLIYLLDEDHCIGHSFFLEAHLLSQIRDVFVQQIFPLLEEYFQGDWAKIKLVMSPFQDLGELATSPIVKTTHFDLQEIFGKASVGGRNKERHYIDPTFADLDASESTLKKFLVCGSGTAPS